MKFGEKLVKIAFFRASSESNFVRVSSSILGRFLTLSGGSKNRVSEGKKPCFQEIPRDSRDRSTRGRMLMSLPIIRIASIRIEEEIECYVKNLVPTESEMRP